MFVDIIHRYFNSILKCGFYHLLWKKIHFNSHVLCIFSTLWRLVIAETCCSSLISVRISAILFVVKGPAADATDAPQPWCLLCNPVMKLTSFFVFPCNGAPVEWNSQGRTKVLGENPVPVPLCPSQITHGPTRDSAVRGRRLTAWAMARP
jgi:hypothetical protein